MRRVVLAALLVIAVALAVNTVVTDRQTEAAKADVGRVLDLPGGDLQVRERGPSDASPIVLLHCYTCSIHWWERIEPLLSTDHRVISIDLLGHGGSEKPSEGYGTEDQADGIAEALDRLGVRNALIVGQSLGGSIGTAVAERHPELARGVVIMDTPPRGEYRDLPFTQRIATTPVIGQLADRITPDSAVRDGLSDAFAPGTEIPDQFVEDVRRMTYRSFEDVPDQSSGYIDEKALDDRLAATGLPVLVIFGAQDTVVAPPDKAADEFRDIPGARVEMLPGIGHTPQWEAPQRSARLVQAFAERTLARP